MITLNLENKSITLATHEVQGKTLYKAQDLLNGYCEDKLQAANKLKYWKKSNEELVKNSLVSIEGSKGGTYLPEELVYALASSISVEFMLAVMTAFKHLVHGNVEAAHKIAVERVTVHPIMSEKRPKRLIVDMLINSKMNVVAFTKNFLKSMDGNSEVTLKERIRTAKSLHAVIHESHKAAGAALDIAAMALHEKAKCQIAEYIKHKTTQVANMKATTFKRHATKAERENVMMKTSIEVFSQTAIM